MIKKVLSAFALVTMVMAPAWVEAKALSDAQIKAILIKESLAAYPGNCPCPYNTDRRGSSCGRRSAYSRPGGESPLCYPGDVSADEVKAYRQSHH